MVHAVDANNVILIVLSQKQIFHAKAVVHTLTLFKTVLSHKLKHTLSNPVVPMPCLMF
jgi:hypothetical protein